MEVQPAPTTTEVAAPTPEAAVLTPQRAASYDAARRTKLQEWANSEPEDAVFELPESVAVTTPPAAVPEEEVQAATSEAAPTPVTEAAPAETTAVTEPVVTPTPVVTTEAVAPSQPRESQPSKHSFSAKVGEEDWVAPDNLTISYRADDRDVSRPIEEVVKLAKLGENFDRRSRNLAEMQRSAEAEIQGRRQRAEQELAAGWQEVWETVRRFAEDAEYREEFLEEFNRLQNNPDEVQLRIKAKRADELEQQLQQQRQVGAAEWNRKVWQTVDSIIAEQVNGPSSAYQFANPDRIRQRFHEAFKKQGKAVLNENFVKELIKADHESIASVVTREKEKALAEKDKEIARTKTETAVETRNKIVDQALQREQVARVVPSGTVTPAEKAAPQIKSAREASQRLKDWANS